ncbi:hypothetical protein HPB50_009943 [Hyalomma asiaticum]|uniref:Uncharacterized protein n=1 Tax=Hyalomma asiaticum TaxID=266040 RepID=A0ACB7TFI4_HYAAI|nr:hypothetical protein HPB50_009943 [Hyalomma asiaticum]
MAPNSATASSTVHFQTRFWTCEELAAEDSERVAVQQKLGAMPATERKFQMMPEPEDSIATTEGEKYFLMQGDALSDLLSKTPCQRCLTTRVKFQRGTQLGDLPRSFS